MQKIEQNINNRKPYPMNIKHLFFAILFIFFANQIIFASAQRGDILIYKQDTFELFANPLESHPEIKYLREGHFGLHEDFKNGYITNCLRGYVAEWTIEDNQLYLSNIFTSYYPINSEKTDLKQLFGDKCINGKVKADWLNGTLISPQGNLIYSVHMTYESFYEKQVAFKFDRGNLIDVITYDNSKSKISTYNQSENLAKFIYSNIDWDALPTFDETILVSVCFSANEAGIIDSTVIKKGRDTTFNNEAIRVIKSIPQWDILYKMGVHKRLTICYSIRFNAENRAKYNPK